MVDDTFIKYLVCLPIDFLSIMRRTIRANIVTPGLIGNVIRPTNKTLYVQMY